MTDLSKDELRKAKEKVAKDNFYESWTDLTNHEPDPIIRDCLIDAYDLALTSQRSELLKELRGRIEQGIDKEYNYHVDARELHKRGSNEWLYHNDIADAYERVLSLLEQPKQ